MGTEKLLTFNETKDYLSVNKATLHKLIREESLPAFRVGKQFRFDKSELQSWLKHKRVNVNINETYNKKPEYVSIWIIRKGK